MASSFLYLRQNQGRKPQLIYVGLRINNEQHTFATGIKVNPLHWDSKRRKVKNISSPDIQLPSIVEANKSDDEDLVSFTNLLLSKVRHFINERKHLPKDIIKSELEFFLSKKSELEDYAFDLHRFVLKCINDNTNLSKAELVAKIKDHLNRSDSETSIFDFVATFISDSEQGIRLNDGKALAYRTIQRYRTTEKLLRDVETEYDRPLTFNNIDKAFIDYFNAYMANTKNYTPTTMGKHISTLKTFMHEATSEGLNSNMDFTTKAFKAIHKSSDSIALTEDELNELYSLNLEANTRLERVRDLFVFGANTGLRFSDFSSIKAENIKKEGENFYLDIIQFKTKGRVIIPVNEIVLQLLKKYNNQMPEGISNQKFNQYLKEVTQKSKLLQETYSKTVTKGGVTTTEHIPRWQLTSSHTARRTFATNAYERGVPTLSIMAITGHKTEKAFLSYIKTDARKHAQILRQNMKR
jgi:site-specific recombinase XerD